jgi:uncharacterized membrane protein
MRKQRDRWCVLILGALSLALYLWPQAPAEDKPIERTVARIDTTDDSLVGVYGVIIQGDQDVSLTILKGSRKGESFTAGNTLIGDPEFDYLYRPGDKALVSIHTERGTVDVLGPYRLATGKLLGFIFFALLIAVAGMVGLKAILSFVFSILLIWKVFIPLGLRGVDPIPLGLGIVALLTASITLLVGGIGRKGLTAFLGGFLGLLTTCVLALSFAPHFHLSGATRPFAKALFATHPDIDIYRFFIAGIFIAASGAVMDLAMDIAAALEEIKQHKPQVTFKELFLSGMRVSRVVVGTMTTTLLLAYSGGYMMMLMYFVAQDIPVDIMLNSTFLSSEILNTLVGSFGLVTVAPFSALIGAALFSRNKLPVQT